MHKQDNEQIALCDPNGTPRKDDAIKFPFEGKQV